MKLIVVITVPCNPIMTIVPIEIFKINLEWILSKTLQRQKKPHIAEMQIAQNSHPYVVRQKSSLRN
jgi:hypothetical protein